MNKISKLLTVLATVAFTLTSCEDVPSPFGFVTPPGKTVVNTVTITPTGTGAANDPFNVQAAIDYVTSLGADVESAENVYVKGIVISISEISTQYGNASFVIADDADGSNKFTAYRVKGFNNQKVDDAQIVKVGDEVVVCGKIVNYRGNTPETVQNSSYIYSVNGNTGGGTTPTPVSGEAKGSGTQADPYNVQAIVNFVSSLNADVDTQADYYVKGIVKSIPNNGISTQYNNVSFYISDDKDGSNEFYVYRAKGLNGGDVTENMIKVGDEVVVFGSTWVNYRGNTPETKQGEAYIVSITPGSDDTPGTTPGGEVSGNSITATMANFGLANAADLTTLTLSDGTTLTFAQNDGSNGPKYYNSGSAARMYVSNSLTINAGSKTITKVVLNAYADNNASYTAEGNVSGKAGSQTVTPSLSGTTFTFSGFSSPSLVISNAATGTGSTKQLRIVSLVITYAE